MKKKRRLILFIISVVFLFLIFIPYFPKILAFIHNPAKCGSSPMSLSEAMNLASHSVCSNQGSVSFLRATCNSYTETWWLSFTPKEKHEGCFPACVVDSKTKEVTINWECTGVLRK